ncbi:hypothetical protein TVAG_392560 [Trichomonas vaginalis G3]|uniref:Uncharacterized protein n=1 Tax=Trichomonas vaginalis (strain ATCC PRA-98 / G3) TaxID=412133 RepID=A2DWV7_TRIV3|nr:armadillo (ARM) repeat-containing protein family [Trichomonas vaginalis G3]EAY15139.1 hypothetical protein TVAG_392560 [Trichomonas vaginalis G3]KAI5499169.1 armadillo (ARM) repeat-containing protein family [Trichomonas vaginalis G3]|eukprot:XP_001327362.1 hypothetical protein [Trichomonas vaginalis G3]
MEGDLSIIKKAIDNLKSPDININNSSVEFLEQWKSSQNCIPEAIEILKSTDNEDYQLIIIQAIKHNIIYNYDYINDDAKQNLIQILYENIEKSRKENDDSLLTSFLNCYSILITIQFPENFVEESLDYPCLCYLSEVFDCIYSEKYVETSKRNYITSILINNVDKLFNKLFSLEKYDQWSFKMMNICIRTFPHEIVFQSNLIQNLFNHYYDDIDSSTTCFDSLVFFRNEFQIYFQQLYQMILEFMFQVGQKYQQGKSFIAYFIVKYHNFIEYSQEISSCIQLLKDLSWIQQNNFEEYWEYWKDILSYYAMKKQAISKEELLLIFESFSKIVTTGISSENLFDNNCKLCFYYLTICLPQEITDFVQKIIFSSEKIFVLSFVLNIDREWCLQLFSDLLDKTKETGGEVEYCALTTLFVRILFYESENEELFNEFCNFVEFVFENARTIPILNAIISSLNYLALRRYKLFSINNLRLLNPILNFAGEFTPENFGDNLAKRTFSLIGKASRYEDCREAYSSFLSTLARKIVDGLIDHYTKIIISCSSQNLNDLQNDEKIPNEEIEDNPMDNNDNQYYQENNDVNEIHKILESELAEEEENNDELDRFISKNDTRPLNVNQIPESEYIRCLLDGFELLAIAAESNRYLSAYMCAVVMPMLSEFIGSVKIVKNDMFSVISEVYKFLERLFLASDLPFEEIKESFNRFIDVAFNRSEFASSCIHLLIAIMDKYPEVQFYLLAAYDQIIAPNIMNITEATPYVLEFMWKCNFWVCQIEFPLNVIENYRDLQLHEISYLLDFIRQTMKRGLPEFINNTLENYGIAIVSTVLEILTDPIYNRYCSDSIECLRLILLSASENNFDRDTIVNIITDKFNNLIPLQTETIPQFVNNIINEHEDFNVFFNLVSSFLIESHCYVGYIPSEYEDQDIEMFDDSDNEDLDLIPDDDIEENWDTFIQDVPNFFEKFARKEKIREEEEESNENQQDDGAYYFFGGFMVEKSPFLEETEMEMKNSEMIDQQQP